jgi:hypothetical protein
VPSGSNVIWVIDSSSIVDLKILPLAIRSQVIRHLNALVAGNRLVYPRQVLEELRSYASPRALESDVPYMWAKGNEAQACHPDRLINEAKAILDAYPDLIDPDAAGRDPADPTSSRLLRNFEGARAMRGSSRTTPGKSTTRCRSLPWPASSGFPVP